MRKRIDKPAVKNNAMNMYLQTHLRDTGFHALRKTFFDLNFCLQKMCLPICGFMISK